MWLVKTKWYHTFIYVLNTNTTEYPSYSVRSCKICKIFIFHILDWTIEDQQQQCWFVVLGRGCVWQLVAQNGKIWKTKQKTRPTFRKTRCLSEASQNKQKTKPICPSLQSTACSSAPRIYSPHATDGSVCCPTTTGTSLLWNTVECQRYCRCCTHQPTSLTPQALPSQLVYIADLRQSYPQVGNCEKHGYRNEIYPLHRTKVGKTRG